MKFDKMETVVHFAGLFLITFLPTQGAYAPQQPRRVDRSDKPGQAPQSDDPQRQQQRHPVYVPEQAILADTPQYPNVPYPFYGYPMEPCQCNCNNLPVTGGVSASSCEWRVVFKGVEGNGRSIYNDFVSGGYINGNVPAAASVTNTDQYRDHIILDNWNNLYIKRVKLEVYEEGVCRAWFVFNGIGSNIRSWMGKERLIASSYDSVKANSFVYFSVDGQEAKERPFFIANTVDCAAGCGYLIVSDASADPKDCPWEEGVLPTIMFSVDECGDWNTPDIVHADRLVISARICDMDW